MTLWHIIRFTTIRHLWLTTITPGKGQRRTKPNYDKWVAVKQRNAVVWDPNELHRFLNGDKMESNLTRAAGRKGQD